MTRLRTIALSAAAVAATATALTASTATAAPVTIPDRHTVICETASFYPQYDSATGPSGTPRTLHRGDGVGHNFDDGGAGPHPVYNGWAATQDFGPNDWGFMRVECIG